MCADLRRSPGGKFAAKVQHCDPVADVEDQVHMMLDKQDPATGRSDRLDEGAEPRDLVGREACGGFVKNQEGRAQHQRPGDLHETKFAMLQPVRALIGKRL